MIELRAHQHRGLEMLRDGFRAGHLRQILVMPTGAGKTITAASVALSAKAKGNVALFVVDRIELAAQAAETMQRVGLTVSIMQGENTCIVPDHDVVVASIQTLSRRRPPDARLVIIDECHILHRAHVNLIERWSALPIIGLTATPFTCGLGKYFSSLVVPTTIRELTTDGLLVPVVAYGPSKPDLVGIETRAGDYAVGQLSARMHQATIHADIVDTWRRLGEGRPTLAFCVDIAHAKSVAASFNDVGVTAAHVDGYQDSEERRDTIAKFKAGEITILASVACLSVGFDAPIAACAILARPTKSLTLHLQQIGRVLRPYPDKTDAIVLDHSGNCERHGLPEDIAIGALDQGTRTWGTHQRNKALPKPCPKCSHIKPPSTHECPKCGFKPERDTTVQQSEGELIALTFGASTKSNRRLYQEFVGCADQFGKSRGWAYHLYLAKVGSKPDWGWRHLEPLAPSAETLRYVKSRMLAFAKGQGRAA